MEVRNSNGSSSLPTQEDRPVYLACLDSTPQAGGRRSSGRGYRFFEAQLVAADDPDDPSDIARIEDAVMSGPPSCRSPRSKATTRIASSNPEQHGAATHPGRPLRNYLFMRLPTR